MARIRTVKPEFWTSAQVMECSPMARLLFVGMLNFADDAGRMTFSPKTLKAQIYPSDDISSSDIERMLVELSSNGLILVYSADGKEFISITGWHHQKIDKPRPSKLPAPFAEGSTTVRREVATDLKGREGKGREHIQESRAAALDDWPEDFGDQFWQAYPRKTEKLAAMRKLASIRKSGVVSFADLLAGVRRYAAANTEPKFTKHPTTWLNAGCWADETQPGGTNGNGNHAATRGSASADFFAGMRSVAADIAGDGAAPGPAAPEIPRGRVEIDG